jgi:hypothetical protein
MTDPLDALRSTALEVAGQRAQILSTAADLATQADLQREAARVAALGGDAGGYNTATADATALFAQRRGELTGLTAADAQLAQAIAALAGDPCDLEPDVPLALLPVRLETRYTTDGASLRVRMFPDDIHVDRLDRGLTDHERAAGTAYWQAIWDGADETAAWQTLLASVQPSRAEWVAAALTPDLSTRPNPPVPGTVPVLGNPPPRQQLAPVARALPDRFVVVAVQGDQVSRKVGEPIPVSLVVGLPPTADPADLIHNGTVTFGPGMEWMIDPTVAESVGMLVTVPLAVPNAAVDVVLAVGVRGSQGPDDAAGELAALLEAHRFAEGSAFLRPGTPTNNTETDRTAWTAKAPPVPPVTTLSVAPADSAGAAATGALGLSGTAGTGLDIWPDASYEAEPVAAAANTALWQATWGTFIERIVAGSFPTPNIGDDLRESWRDWWQDQVRGGGPLPAMRVGNQPYGVLPVSAVQATWQPNSGAAIEQPLLTVLRNTRSLMTAAVGNVPAIGTGTLDQTLLEALGSAPHSIGMRVRSLGAEGLLRGLENMYSVDLGSTNQAAQDQLVETLFLQLGVGSGRTGLSGVIGKRTRPLGLPLVTDDVPDTGVVGDAAFLAALRADQPRTVASVLQALLEICAAREQHAVDVAAPAEQVKQLIDRSVPLLGNDAQRYVQLVNATQEGRVDTAALHNAAGRLDKQFGVSGPATLASLQPILSTRTSLVDFAMQAPLPGQLSQTVAVTALGAWLRASARLAEFWEAAQLLVKADVDQRDHAVSETLDCASHRYDAWLTSLPTSRLRQLRGSVPGGVLLGAYGWVEGLTPGGTTTRPGGYVHAPSLTHAATAGVLRSGYLTHNQDAAGDSALAVDLSSARVRAATSLLDGVRAGQPLGALIGYLIERRLHENHLDVYTLSIRSLAPIAANRVVADALPPAAQEAIGAGNVVDGVRLLALPRETIWAKLANPPADNPYLKAADWPAPDVPTQNAIGAVLDEAAAAYDAVSDVLLAESVHQLVQGNTARAAAAMSAAAGGDTAPVEPEVLRTPTRAAAITHRVLVLFDDAMPGTGGWSKATPRAIAEPNLAAWAENQLGPATAIVLQEAADGTLTTLDAAGLSALDVVFDSATNSSNLVSPALDAELRALVPGLAALPLALTPDPAWPAGTRAIGEVSVCARALHRLISGASSVSPASFARGSDQPVRTSDASTLLDRLKPVVDGLGQAVTELADALANATPVDDAVTKLRAYGIAMPTGAEVAVLAEARKRLDAAMAITNAGPPADPAAAAQAVGDALFGTGFLVLPKVSGAADLFSASFGGVTPPRAAIRRWLLGLASVRPDVSSYTSVLLAADATSSAPGPGRSLRVAQLAPSGTAGTATWLGLPLPKGSPSPDQPVTSVLVDAPSGYDGNTLVTGLVVDDWVEQLPRRNSDGSAAITTGLAVNANAPGARAPQAILLAVSPDGSRWSTDGLIAVLDETRELARIRGVTLERLLTPSPILPAIQDQSWSLQGEPTLDLRVLATEIATVGAMLPYVKETGS